MPTEELLTRWTIRLALVCYVTVLASHLVLRRDDIFWHRATRLAWTAGCVLFLAHVAAAFQFYHGWSHTHVLADTARQTEELMGWSFGEGIYFSYLFTLIWVADVAWWWLCPACYEGRGRGWNWSIHGFMLFIAFNGALVFEGGLTRWFGVAACAGLLLLFAWRTMLSPNRPPHHADGVARNELGR